MKQLVVLVTGASSGIGKATAHLFAEHGHITYPTARRREAFPELQALACHPLFVDLTDEVSMLTAIQEIEAKHGAIDVLVNNAGYSQAGPLEELPLSALRQQFETNVFGPLRLAQLVLPGMRNQGGGRIMTVSSLAGVVTMMRTGAYTMSKHAVECFSDVLRYEVKPFGVKVITIQPGGSRRISPLWKRHCSARASRTAPMRHFERTSSRRCIREPAKIRSFSNLNRLPR
jgi:NAD(P)-dependent dehydrogenase (short-subunit alcohol dehydrogenase family)